MAQPSCDLVSIIFSKENNFWYFGCPYVLKFDLFFSFLEVKTEKYEIQCLEEGESISIILTCLVLIAICI